MDLNKAYKKTASYWYNLAKQIRAVFFDKKRCMLKESKFERYKKPSYLLPAIIKFRENTVNIIKDKKCADTPIKHGMITATPTSTILTNYYVSNNLKCNSGFLSHDILALGFGFIRLGFLSYFTSRHAFFVKNYYRGFSYKEKLHRKTPTLKIILLRVKKFSHGFG